MHTIYYVLQELLYTICYYMYVYDVFVFYFMNNKLYICVYDCCVI